MNGGNLFWTLVLAGAAFGLIRGLFTRVRESARNANLRAYVDGRDAAFKAGFVSGRQWLAAFVAEAEEARDRREEYLRHKSHPARKAAEIVRAVKHEKRTLTERLK